MKTNLPAFALLLVPCTMLLVSAPAQVPVPGTPAAPAAAEPRRDPFERTKANIDLLLARRITPPAFDPTRFNPFTIGPAGGLAPDPKTPDEPTPVATSESLLRLLAPRLRVTGYFSREGLSFAVIDGVPRREGDFIILTHQGAPVNLRVKRVDNDRVLLGLGDAEYILRF